MMVDLCLMPDDGDDVAVVRMRHHRNRLLAQSDWTQLPDAPVDTAAWAVYRQELRDAPASWTPGPTWDAPTPPE